MFLNCISKCLPATVLGLSLAFVSGFAKPPEPDNLSDEELTKKVKVISKIINIVKWSPTVTNQNIFNYCLLGSKNKNDDAYLKKINFENHKIEVIHLKDAQQADGLCQSIFLENPDMSNLSSLLEYFNRKPILLLSNETDFARMGGHVSLFKIDESFAFTLNIPSIEQSGFEVDLSSFTNLIIEPMPDDL
jgi:YfiR/HmsC-like